MKTTPTILTALLTALLVLSPSLALAAGTISVSTNASAYSGSQTISISGTANPAPGSGYQAFIQVTNPAGQVVFADSVAVGATTGTFSDSFAAGGTSAWVSGTYTVSASIPGYTAGTTSFTYTAPTKPAAGAVSLVVQAVAASPVAPGSNVGVSVLVTWSNGTAVTKVSFAGSHYHNPSGSPTGLGSPTSVGPGMYWFTISLPSNAATGLYAVHIEANASGTIAWAQAGFTVADLATGSAQQQILSALQSLSSSVSSSLTNIQSSLTSMSTTLGSVNTAVQGLSSSVSNAATQATNAANAVASTQTYVLVVAVLAAITLVLELAILVRKLS